MASGNYLRLAVPLVMVCSLLPCASVLLSQDSQTQDVSPVAEAARRAREQKKIKSSASKVITDDDLPTKDFKPGAEGLNVGSSPKSDAAPPNPAAVAAAESADKAAASVGKNAEKKGENPEIAELKGKIARTEKELDLLQRELSLDQDTFYSRPDYASDTAGKTKLAGERQEIKTKQEDLDRLKTRLAALQELEARKKAAASEATSSPETQKPVTSAPPQP